MGALLSAYTVWGLIGTPLFLFSRAKFHPGQAGFVSELVLVTVVYLTAVLVSAIGLILSRRRAFLLCAILLSLSVLMGAFTNVVYHRGLWPWLTDLLLSAVVVYCLFRFVATRPARTSALQGL
jgi:hypothetical protein